MYLVAESSGEGIRVRGGLVRWANMCVHGWGRHACAHGQGRRVVCATRGERVVRESLTDSNH